LCQFRYNFVSLITKHDNMITSRTPSMLLLSSNIAFHNIAKMGRGERKEKILQRTRAPSMLILRNVAFHDKLGRNERKEKLYTRKKGTEQLTRAVYYSDYIFTTASLCSAAATGAYIGNNTAFGKKLSGPVCSMLMGYVLKMNPIYSANLEITGSIRLIVSALATPMILQGANLSAIRNTFNTLLKPFVTVAFVTIFGGFVGAKLFLKNEILKPLSAALIAKNIGSGINYIATCQALGVSPYLQSQGLVVDNVLAFIYFPIVYIFGDRYIQKRNMKEEEEEEGAPTDFSTEDVKTSLALTFAILAASHIEAEFWSTILEGVDSSRLFLPIATVFSILTATFLNFKSNVVNAGNFIGQCLLYIFFASAGLSSPPLGHAFTNDLELLYFACTMYAIHLFAIGFLFSSREILVASNAGIGGPATAAAFAKAKHWKELIAPAILVGNVGNAFATFIALIFSSFV